MTCFWVCVSDGFTDVHGASLSCFNLGAEGLENVQSRCLDPVAGAGGQ